MAVPEPKASLSSWRSSKWVGLVFSEKEKCGEQVGWLLLVFWWLAFWVVFCFFKGFLCLVYNYYNWICLVLVWSFCWMLMWCFGCGFGN